MKIVLVFCYAFLMTGCVGILPTMPLVSMSSSYTPPVMDVATPPIPRPELSASFSKARHVMLYGSIDNPWGELTLTPKQDGPISKITVTSNSSCHGTNFAVLGGDAGNFTATQELPLATPIKGMKGQPVTLTVRVDAPSKDQCGGIGATSFRLENIEATVNGFKTPATLMGDSAVDLVEASNVAFVTLEKAATTPLTAALHNGEPIQPVQIKLTADNQEDVHVIDVQYWNFSGVSSTMLLDRNAAHAGAADKNNPLRFTNIRYFIPKGASRELTLDGKATGLVRQNSFDVTVTYQGVTTGVKRRVTKTFYW